ncbi:MAG: antibiotic biosynthesis monooxygenase [Chloroflexi bacterium]|nr:antibiotic biosynthesis monooxygenase [Chloroflexota bacterium]
MIIIAGTVQVRPEKRDEAVAAAIRMAAATRQEPGCLSYGFYADLADPHTIFLFEQWADEEALAAHFQTPHMAEFNQITPQVVAAVPEIKRYDVTGV